MRPATFAGSVARDHTARWRPGRAGGPGLVARTGCGRAGL